MRSYIIVWTEGLNIDNSRDFYEIRETEEEAQELYNKLLGKDGVLIASITGVIESTDYEPLETPTDSEKQLEEFIIHISEQAPTELELSTQGDDTGIYRDKAIYLCTVKEHSGKEYLFGGISEAFYDKMIEKYYSYEEEEDFDRDELIDAVEELLIQKWAIMGIELPHNHYEIRMFIVNDIQETADPENWHSGDFDIAFRRWIEAQSSLQP